MSNKVSSCWPVAGLQDSAIAIAAMNLIVKLREVHISVYPLLAGMITMSLSHASCDVKRL